MGPHQLDQLSSDIRPVPFAHQGPELFPQKLLEAHPSTTGHFTCALEKIFLDRDHQIHEHSLREHGTVSIESRPGTDG